MLAETCMHAHDTHYALDTTADQASVLELLDKLQACIMAGRGYHWRLVAIVISTSI